MSDDDIQKIALDRARSFRDEVPTTAAAAAKIILDGVKGERWRILVGDDAHRLDERVRHTPEQAYEPEFYQSFAAEVGWRLGVVARRYTPHPSLVIARESGRSSTPRLLRCITGVSECWIARSSRAMTTQAV
jgi:hypothetical protein